VLAVADELPADFHDLAAPDIGVQRPATDSVLASGTRTEHPARNSRSAATRPAVPAPTTTTSHSMLFS
jgi:hypothetical protein